MICLVGMVVVLIAAVVVIKITLFGKKHESK